MKLNKQFVIALDGPAGSGKSTVASILARELNCIHADSGAMYRTLTLATMQAIGSGDNTTDFGQMFGKNTPRPQELGVSVGLDSQGKQTNLIKGKDIGNKIRTLDVTSRIRFIADSRPFRDQVNHMLRELASKTSLVADGRDIASVVFPQTPYQFFLDASVEIRAQRRLLELKEKKLQTEISLEELISQIQKRDLQDRNREFGALMQSPKAILIDTSSITTNAVVQLLLSQLQKKF